MWKCVKLRDRKKPVFNFIENYPVLFIEKDCQKKETLKIGYIDLSL